MATTKATTLAHTLGGISSDISTAEINRLDGVTGDLQTQLDAKAPLASPDFTGTVDLTGTTISLDNDQISGLKIDGGTISNFASTGITDDATSEGISINDTRLRFAKFPHINFGHSLRQQYFEWNGTISNGGFVNLLSITSAYTDVHFIGVIEALHGARTYSMEIGTFGGYGLHSGGYNSGSVTFSVSTSSGIGTLRASNSSASNASTHIGLIIFGDNGFSVNNGTLYT